MLLNNFATQYQMISYDFQTATVMSVDLSKLSLKVLLFHVWKV